MAWKQITVSPEQVETLVVQNIARGAPDWPVTLAYTDGDLTSAVYANGTERYRQTLVYDAGNLDEVVYAYSDDSGTTYTNIGTEALVYTAGTLTSTTWTPA